MKTRLIVLMLSAIVSFCSCHKDMRLKKVRVREVIYTEGYYNPVRTATVDTIFQIGDTVDLEGEGYIIIK